MITPTRSRFWKLVFHTVSLSSQDTGVFLDVARVRVCGVDAISTVLLWGQRRHFPKLRPER